MDSLGRVHEGHRAKREAAAAAAAGAAREGDRAVRVRSSGQGAERVRVYEGDRTERESPPPRKIEREKETGQGGFRFGVLDREAKGD